MSENDNKDASIENQEIKEAEEYSQQPAEEKKSETSEQEESPQKSGGNGAAEKQPEFDFTNLLPGNIEEVLQFNILQFREWAYVFMGLVPHPKEKKVVKDLRQAKIAVDSASALFEIAMPHLNEKLQREFKIIISDLKMNFIAKVNQ
jgi:hypothetical protein